MNLDQSYTSSAGFNAQVLSGQRAKLHWPIVLLLFALCIFFGFISQKRLIAGDEGYYLFAARLVAEGQIPYLDFFYPQMPLLPYLYGGWMKLFGMSWESGRLLSALFCSLLALLIFLHVREIAGILCASIAVILFASSGMVFPWFTLAKSYAAPTLFLFASYYLLYRYKKSPSWVAIVCSGLLFSFAVNCRAYLVITFPVLAWLAWRSGRAQGKSLHNFALFFIGAACGGILPLVLFLRDQDAFVFNNIGYHMVRSDRTAQREIYTKIGLLQRLFGIVESRQLFSFQYAALIWISLAYSLVSLMRLRAISASACLAYLLFLISFIPEPSYLQYFCVTVPFLLVHLFEALNALLNSSIVMRSRTALTSISIIGFLALGIYLSGFIDDYTRFTKTGDGVIGVVSERNAKVWNIETVSEVAMRLDELAQPGEPVLSYWPGFLLESHAVSYPLMENHFGWQAADKMGIVKDERYKIISSFGVSEEVKAGKPRFIVIKDSRNGLITAKNLPQFGYEQVFDVNTVKIFRRSN